MNKKLIIFLLAVALAAAAAVYLIAASQFTRIQFVTNFPYLIIGIALISVALLSVGIYFFRKRFPKEKEENYEKPEEEEKHEESKEKEEKPEEEEKHEESKEKEEKPEEEEKHEESKEKEEKHEESQEKEEKSEKSQEITFEKDLHVNIRRNRISGLSKEDIDKLRKEKVKIPVILPYDFELTSIPTKEQYSGKFKKDLDKFAKKFSKHLNIKKIKQIDKEKFTKKDNISDMVSDMGFLELFRNKTVEYISKKEIYSMLTSCDISEYALTTLDHMDLLVKEFNNIVYLHIKEQQQRDDLIYQFKTLINTSITKGYCTETQLDEFMKNIGDKLPIPNNIDKTKGISDQDYLDNALNKFIQEFKEINHLEKEGNQLIKNIEVFINEIKSKGYCTEIQLDKFKDKIGVEFKNAIQQNDMTEAKKSNKFILASMFEVIGEYAYLDIDYVMTKFYTIVGNDLNTIDINKFRTLFEDIILQIKISGYCTKELLNELEEETKKYNGKDFAGLLEYIKKYTVENDYEEEKDYSLEDDCEEKKDDSLESVPLEERNKVEERIGEFKKYIGVEFPVKYIKLLYYIEQSNTTEANKLASKLEFPNDDYSSLKDLLVYYDEYTYDIAKEKSTSEIIDIYIAGHKSIAFYKMYQLFSNHNSIKEQFRRLLSKTALFRRLFSDDNTLKALFKLLLNKGIDDKIINNTEKLIERLEEEIQIIYEDLGSASESDRSKLEAKAELIGSAIQIIHNQNLNLDPYAPIGKNRFIAQFKARKGKAYVFNDTDMKESRKDDKAVKIETKKKTETESIEPKSILKKKDIKNKKAVLKKEDIKYKNEVSFVSFFSDKSTPETEEKDNDRDGDNTLSPNGFSG